MKTIAIFDFDGTITTKDTLFDFIRYSLGLNRLLTGLFYLFPALLLHQLKIITNHAAKEILFDHFFRGMHQSVYQNYCRLYSSRIAKIVNNKAIERILWHKNQGHLVVCVSASVEDWIVPWANGNNIEQVIATQIEVKDNCITGKFFSQNCYGEEKVKRFLAEFPARDQYTLYVYGDSKGDKELLDIADYGFYKSF